MSTEQAGMNEMDATADELAGRSIDDEMVSEPSTETAGGALGGGNFGDGAVDGIGDDGAADDGMAAAMNGPNG